MPKTVRIRNYPDGRVVAEVEGVKGSECTELTKFLDELFGEPENRDLKQSYYDGEITDLDCDILPEGHCG
jgi:hypothetical protein